MAAVTSPTSASPAQYLLEWDEAAVHSYLTHLGIPQYEDLIFEHGITGDVLAVMNHETLQDMGIDSIGHRLNLLRAVWDLKQEQGIEMGEEDWRPQDAELERKKALANVDRLLDLIAEQQARLRQLERGHSTLLSALEDSGIAVPMTPSADIDVNQSNGLDKSVNSLRWRDFNAAGPRSDGDDPERSLSRNLRRASQVFPSSLTSSATYSAPAPPHSADSATFKDSFTPTTHNTSYSVESPLAMTHGDKVGNSAKSLQPSQPPTFQRQISGSSIMGNNTPTPPSSGPPVTAHHASNSSYSQSNPSSLNNGSNSLSQSTSSDRDGEKSRAKDAARNAAKSFRVTLDDPCFKVLPAALKKYKINDDWKMYALFICFGNTERCLSYDEKPLMLFQKLKEGGQKPVFMLRHMRDVKSPIAVAQSKQAVKLGLPPSTTENVLPKIKPASDTTSPTKATALEPGRRPEEGQTPSGGAFPELPSPGLRDGDAAGQNGPKSAAGGRTLVDKDGKLQSVSYAVAIYPYIADRQDEFDVAVGATYIILSKAKGWYIVQRDPLGHGNIVPDQSKSGWVPAGCLLELHSPIASLPNSQGDPAYPGLAPVIPSAIMSSSYPGIVLMDFKAEADDQVTLKEGEKVRVYKKYCHWSYTIKQDTGERGWIPAWFIGKQSTVGGSDSQPSSAATPTASQSQAQSTTVMSAGNATRDDGRGDEEEGYPP